jgi:esterase
MLSSVVHGAPTSEPPLVIAHGLFGSARNWGVIAKKLSDQRQVIAVDMRNHGSSPWEAVQSYEAMAEDLAEVIRQAGGRADLLGHSMGGKAAMTLALTRPDLLERLIIVDIAPVAYSHSQLSFVKALRDVDLTKVVRRGDADAQLKTAVPDPGVRAFLLQSLELDGIPRWKLNLDALETEMPKIMSFPETDAAHGGPALFIRGELSDYVTETGLARIGQLFPAAEHEVIPGAGHWVHAEAPKAILSSVEGYLSR